MTAKTLDELFGQGLTRLAEKGITGLSRKDLNKIAGDAGGYFAIGSQLAGGWRQNAAAAGHDHETQGFTLNTGYPNASRRGFKNFRFFCPPGTVRVTCKLAAVGGSHCGVAMSAGTPPKWDYSGLNHGNFDSWNWDRTNNGGSLEFLRGDSDYLAKAYDGTINAVYWQSNTSAATEGIWVYGKILNAGTNAVHTVHPTVLVHSETFFKWFNSVKDDDSKWDREGSPVTVSPSPTPKPMPGQDVVISLPGDDGQFGDVMIPINESAITVKLDDDQFNALMARLK